MKPGATCSTSILVAFLAVCSPVQEPAPSRADLDPDVVARVGVNLLHSEDLELAAEKLPIGWFRNYTFHRSTAGARDVEFVPILLYREKADTPEMLELLEAWYDAGLIPNPTSVPTSVMLDAMSRERLAKRIESSPELFLPGTLFQVGIEPGYSSSSGHDDRLPPDIVSDARLLRELVDGFDRGYRLALGGIATARHDFTRKAYRGRDGFDFWREILELAEKDLFDAFVVHPYPTDMEHPRIEDLEAQIREARRLLADFGLSGKDLIAGETGVPFRGVDPKEVRAYTAAAVELYLTATDPGLGNPNDGGRLVQRFCWFLLHEPRVEMAGYTDNPGLDFAATSLMRADGDLTPLGEVFRDAVFRVAERPAPR